MRLIEICMENAVCNMKCKYCFGGFTNDHNMHTGVIPVFDATLMDSQLSSVPSDYDGDIKIWGGEPLANYDTFRNVVDYIRPKFKRANLVLITNGSLLTIDVAKYLCSNGIHVTISHDGSGQYIRGKDYLTNESEQVKAIQVLQMNRLFSGFHMVIHRGSDVLEDQIKYWDNISNNVLYFPLNISWSIFRVTDEWTEEFIPNMDRHNEFIKYTLNLMTDNKYHRVKFYLSTDLERALDALVFGMEAKYPCATFDNLTLGLSGKLYRCVQDCERRSGIHDNNIIKKESYKLLPECSNCPVKNACAGMCAVLTDDQRRNNCSNYINFIQYTDELLHADNNRLLYILASRRPVTECLTLDDVTVEELDG